MSHPGMKYTELCDFETSFKPEVESIFQEAYGETHWHAIKHALVKPPAYTSIRCNTMQVKDADEFRDLLVSSLEPFYKRLESQNRQPGILRQHEAMKDLWVIPSCPAVNPAIEYNPKFKSIIVDRKCGEAVLRGSDIFACGVMCASNAIEANDQVNVFVDIEHITTRAFPIDQHKGQKIFVGHGTALKTRAEIFKSMRGLAITMNYRVIADAPPLNSVLAGKLYMQNLPSTVVAHVLDPQPGDVIYDMCAAPGGKTSHVAALMQNTGLVIACDQSRKKVITMKETFSTFSLDLITPLRMDSTQSVLDLRTQQEMHEKYAESEVDYTSVKAIVQAAKEAQTSDQNLPLVKGFFPETFDKILLDPPCSALGLRPRLTHATTLGDLDKCVRVQRNLLWAATFLLKPGGTLVYSTCTVNPQENEQMVQYALQTHSVLELVDQPEHLFVGETGLRNQGLSPENARKVQRFDPSSKLDTMGFFCAKFKKTSSMLPTEPAAKKQKEICLMPSCSSV